MTFMTVAGRRRGWVVRSAFSRPRLKIETWIEACATSPRMKKGKEEKSAEKSAKLRGRVNRKTPLASLLSMNFLGSLNKIHSA
jgi:hypothetical protein